MVLFMGRVRGGGTHTSLVLSVSIFNLSNVCFLTNGPFSKRLASINSRRTVGPNFCKHFPC